jgi:hypothetical protein
VFLSGYGLGSVSHIECHRIILLSYLSWCGDEILMVAAGSYGYCRISTSYTMKTEKKNHCNFSTNSKIYSDKIMVTGMP